MRKNKAQDEVTDNEARVIMDDMEKGEALARQAVLDATDEMHDLIGKMRTKDGRVKTLKDHALYMGITGEFMDTVVTEAKEMRRHMEHEIGMPEDQAKLIASLWLSKVIRNVGEKLND